jgi:hypothetical protein
MENVCDGSQVTEKKKNKMVERSNEGEGAIRNSQEKFGAKLSGPTVGGNDDEAYKTTRAEREAESVGNAKEKEKRRESVKQTNTAAGISSNPGDHPYIFFFLDFSFFPSLAIRNLSLSAPHPQLFFKTLR